MSRITPGTVIVGIFAVLFGLIGAYGVRKYLQVEQPAPPAAPAPPPLLVVPLASMDLQPGRPLVLGDIGIYRMSNEEIAKRRKEGKLPPTYMTNPDQIMTRILRVPLKAGDAFTTDLFYPEGSGPTIAEKLAPGLRAVTIPVEGTGALGGYDGPGSYVDVVFCSRPDAKAGIPETTVTLLEGVQVLAMEEADKRAPPGVKLENRVTLAVTADQANALKIAEGRGTFALSLRNAEDVEIAASSVPQTLDRLLNLPIQNEHVTAIYRAGASQSVSFPGASVTPQPVVSLPVAGVLQMRAAQQTASVEKDVPASDNSGEPAPPASAASPDAAPQPKSPAAALPPTAPAASKSQRLDSPAAATEPKPSDAMDTVTVRIPVSVLLGDKMVGAGLASVSGSRSVVTPPTPALPTPPAPAALPVTTAAVNSGTEPSAPARPRKLLSDIGRKYWDRVPKNAIAN